MSQPEAKLSDVLAQQRTDLAVERTLMGAERTMMAWVRTGLSMIGFGFTIYKVLQAMLKEGVQLTLSVKGPRNLGLFLIGLGTLSAFMGGFDYWLAAKGLHEKYKTRIKKFPFIMPGLIFVLGLWLFVSIILRAELF
jgi:putative membrane protein